MVQILDLTFNHIKKWRESIAIDFYSFKRGNTIERVEIIIDVDFVFIN